MRFPRRLFAILSCAVVASACGQVEEPTAAPPAAPTTLSSEGLSSEALSASTTVDDTIVGDTEAPITSSTEATTIESTTASPATTSPTTTSPTTTSPTTAPTTEPPVDEPIQIRLRLDRRVGDDATADFASITETVLTDERGWIQAGFEFSFSETDYDYTVVLAEGDEVDQLCLPYDTGGRFSCQIGPIVALNAGRWRSAVESWPGTLDEYRTMLVNHEVGHLIGQHHAADRCPADGQPAPVMSQQSSGVAPCTANPWPLGWEIECAAEGVEPLAPPYENDIDLTCGP